MATRKIFQKIPLLKSMNDFNYLFYINFINIE